MPANHILEDYKKYDNFYELLVAQFAERYHIVSSNKIGERLHCSGRAVLKWQTVPLPNKHHILANLAKELDCTVEDLQIVGLYYQHKLKGKLPIRLSDN